MTTSTPCSTMTATEIYSAKPAALHLSAGRLAWHNVKESLWQFDAKLSEKIFMWPSLGRGELYLSLPGSMFGVPVYSMGVLSVVVAGLAELVSADSCNLGPAIALVYIVGAVTFWARCVGESQKLYTLQRSDSDAVASNNDGAVAISKKDTHGLMRPFAPLGKKLGTVTTLLGPHVSVWILSHSSQLAVGAASYYIALFYFTQLVIEVMKTLSQRERPVCALAGKLQNVRRELPQIQHFLSREHSKYSSFPSGDASGAATFAFFCIAVIPAASPYYRIPVACGALCVPLISAFSRLYFHAHFAMDVTVGLIMSVIVATTWTHVFEAHGYTRLEDFTWALMAKIELCVIICWAFTQRLKPKTSENIYNFSNLVKGAGIKLKE
eukprot:m.524684 g.524684  ORF g.524684 m.524684 type:complete len:381 (+) comp21991_c0_seq1:250-1392(+)